LSEKKTPEQPASQTQGASQISQIFGPIKLLPGESEAAYRAGLAGTINELGASTHLQIYLAEKNLPVPVVDAAIRIAKTGNHCQFNG